MSKELTKHVNILASRAGHKMRRVKPSEAWASNDATVAVDINGNRGCSIFFATMSAARDFFTARPKKDKKTGHALEWWEEMGMRDKQYEDERPNPQA